jgi:hypothetical protein
MTSLLSRWRWKDGPIEHDPGRADDVHPTPSVSAARLQPRLLGAASVQQRLVEITRKHVS